jgi:hypothetical protein
MGTQLKETRSGQKYVWTNNFRALLFIQVTDEMAEAFHVPLTRGDPNY